VSRFTLRILTGVGVTDRAPHPGAPSPTPPRPAQGAALYPHAATIAPSPAALAYGRIAYAPTAAHRRGGAPADPSTSSGFRDGRSLRQCGEDPSPTAAAHPEASAHRRAPHTIALRPAAHHASRSGGLIQRAPKSIANGCALHCDLMSETSLTYSWTPPVLYRVQGSRSNAISRTHCRCDERFLPQQKELQQPYTIFYRGCPWMRQPSFDEV
jgi:hypothetical protein